EACILTNCPWLGRVHRGVGAAQKRRPARISVEEIEPGEILLVIGRLHRDSFGRHPGRRRALSDGRTRVGEIDLGEVGYLTHFTFRISCAACNVESTSQPT